MIPDAAAMMPDLTHLSAEERAIIEEVFQRQRAEEEKEQEIAQKADKELEDIERLINERKENAQKLVGTQSDAICQICQKTKFADGIGHKCFYCQLRSCARCGGKTTSKNKSIWACSTCQKRQQILAKTGKWFQSNQPEGQGEDISDSQSYDDPTGGMSQTINGDGSKLNGTQPEGNGDLPRQPSTEKAPSPVSIAPQGPANVANKQAQPIVSQPSTSAQMRPQPMPSPASSASQSRKLSGQQQPHHPPVRQPSAPQPQPRLTQPSSQQRRPSAENRNTSAPSNVGPSSRLRGDPTSTVDTRVQTAGDQKHSTVTGPGAQKKGSRMERTEPPTTVPNVPQVPPVPLGTETRPQKPLGPTVLHGGSRVRRNKLSRQIRSLSSSEDDEGVSSTTRRHSVIEPDFSEKELLKYIYGKTRFNKNNPQALNTTSLPGSRLGLYEIQSTSTPALNQFTAGMNSEAVNSLATRIRYFLQQPVSWQPSADQRRLIGHIVLHRPDEDSGDLGLKVIGGRHSSTGRLGAFITAVKQNSVADYVGQLRPGDEVLEWNGETLQNLTHEGVYHIINSSKHSPKVELIVSRPVYPGNDDFLNVSRKVLPTIPHASPVAFSDYGPPSGSPCPNIPDYYRIPHSKSMLTHNPIYPIEYDPEMQTPLRARVPYDKPVPAGQLFGKIEVSLLYLNHEQELVVTVYHAIDLPPRPSGAPRNPFVKLFLLPDRSEESRRQSKVIYESLNPSWNECFYYYGLSAPELSMRCLELTVWDFDQYNGHDFLGETVIDLSDILLDNQHFSYPLVDMDDENPIKMRIRRSKVAGYPQGRYRSHSANHDDVSRRRGDYDYLQMTGAQYAHPREFVDEQIEGRRRKDRRDYPEFNNGYASDYGQYSRVPPAHSRRPKSATGFRHVHEYEARNAYRSQPIHEEGPYSQYPDADLPPEPPEQPPIPRHQNYQKYQEGSEQQYKNRQCETVMEQSAAGYGSDGSETLSANSAQSMQKKREEQSREQQNNYDTQEIPSYSPRHHFYDNHAAYNPPRGANGRTVRMDMRGLNDVDENGDINGAEERVRSNGGVNLQAQANNNLAMKERKKSLMTRLIPGRNAPNDAKRTGFARSEEVGIPGSLNNPNGDITGVPFTKQSSKDSTDSSDNWQPLMPDAMLGHFMEDLGPGQVVGRQVLASPVLGEIEIGLGISGGCLIVDVIRAKNLVIRPGSKLNPAPYVKVYLMQGKHCMAKAKTQTARKTTAPLFNQQLSFAESFKHKMLQVTVLGDYGRMERKANMGCVLIRLDDLNLMQQPVKSWYKLFHNNSIMGAAPVRKDSETSIAEM
ncbi:unnamed protein product [Bursaphelenchus xylophilus]|uniref:(pine wood nematode) hypothetical protein n=1 Tax=Bursaphelenchus xylophilus TaxID=6326 RepID=A0A1I7RRC7_BURXY|nr:unnamed protein product [Bursaphelenchus xylophilus]CAG9130944.1 unnamed protein product [Bursaphelenchus xylophilus]